MRLVRSFLRSTGGRTVVLVSAFIIGYQGWLTAQASGKVDPDVAYAVDARGQIDLEVELAFPPERFHILYLQKHGRIRRTVGNVVEVHSVKYGAIGDFARNYWIRSIRPAEQ
jgi:hypothetical protein